jgi:hypothetical protein
MNDTNPQNDPMQQINRALGIFLVCFSVIIFIAVFFTETFSGKITNLVAGLILAGIGSIMIVKAKTKA